MDGGSGHWTGVSEQDHPHGKEMQKGKTAEPLQKAEKRREAKHRGEKERDTHLNAEFQRRARRDKKAFLSDQSKKKKNRGKQQNGKD